MRGSSFAVMDNLAQSRINAFQKAIKDKQADEEKTPAEILAKNKFANKLSKFKQIETGTAPARVNNDDAHKATLKNKLAAFEQQAKKEPVEFKKTWAKVGGAGNYKPKTTFA